jgi:hypothetical protein
MDKTIANKEKPIYKLATYEQSKFSCSTVVSNSPSKLLSRR